MAVTARDIRLFDQTEGLENVIHQSVLVALNSHVADFIRKKCSSADDPFIVLRGVNRGMSLALSSLIHSMGECEPPSASLRNLAKQFEDSSARLLELMTSKIEAGVKNIPANAVSEWHNELAAAHHGWKERHGRALS